MVEKEMKTKAYSKEGLSASAKLDPKERERMELCGFLGEMVDELGRQIEAHEAEAEGMQAGLKKGKKDSGKANRLSELERMVERHKWHSGKLEILLRSLENGSVENEQVKDIEESIKYYVEQNQEVDFMEDDSIYDDLNLEEEEDYYGLAGDNDKLSSQDTQSVADDGPDTGPADGAPRTGSVGGTLAKSKSVSQADVPVSNRRPSVQLKSPLPALSTLHSSLPGSVSGKPAVAEMKPAPIPTIPTGQPLKYASAAAAAAASDRSGVGIAPLPPPPSAALKPAETISPKPAPAEPTQSTRAMEPPAKQPTPAPREEPRAAEVSPPTTSQSSNAPSIKPSPQVAQAQPVMLTDTKSAEHPSPDSGIAGLALSHGATAAEEESEEEESIYHLPSSLADLLGAFEETKARTKDQQRPFPADMLAASRLSCPTPLDASKPTPYAPSNPYPYTPAHYPQTPLPIFDDPRLYSRIDTDSLFYAFYYRQGTYQQYLAAKALKGQSWRFHKQYQTWFQRHEEPKSITDEYEQGTYRFFDYESTWSVFTLVPHEFTFAALTFLSLCRMNRRKADFKFAYKFLEDDL